MNTALNQLQYGFCKKTNLGVEETIKRVGALFEKEGFGALFVINVQEKMKEKLRKDMEEYVILGMCNPSLAYQAIEKEYAIGLLLPCNVIVYRKNEKTNVCVVDPEIMLSVTGKDAIKGLAQKVQSRMVSALEKI